MDKRLDDIANKIQAQIFLEMKETYSEIAYKRLLNPLYMGTIDDTEGYARLKGKCGDTMEIFLKFDNHLVKNATYRTDGCGSSNICGSFAVEMTIGKSPDGLLEITGEAILEKLGGLPKGEEHCAFLAAETLQEALNDYMLKEAKGKGRGV